MVPALIIAALAALLLCAATSYAHSTTDQIALGHRGLTTNFVSALMASARTLRGGQRAPWTDQITKVVFTSFKFCKFSSGRREAFRWPQPIPLAEEPIRPTG